MLLLIPHPVPEVVLPSWKLKAIFPRMGADLRGTFSLPSFQDNFSDDEGITDEALATSLAEAVKSLA
ncbi:MAG: hypothetical protein R3F19_10460 [Verrucomicrobiales bacterium]